MKIIHEFIEKKRSNKSKIEKQTVTKDLEEKTIGGHPDKKEKTIIIETIFAR